MDRVNRLDALRDLMIQQLDEVDEKQAAPYNKGRKVASYHVGDLVWRENHALSCRAAQLSGKLAPKYKGPYEVEAFLGPDTYQLKVPDKRKHAKAHVTQLRRYVPRRDKQGAYQRCGSWISQLLKETLPFKK